MTLPRIHYGGEITRKVVKLLALERVLSQVCVNRGPTGGGRGSFLQVEHILVGFGECSAFGDVYL